MKFFSYYWNWIHRVKNFLGNSFKGPGDHSVFLVYFFFKNFYIFETHKYELLNDI